MIELGGDRLGAGNTAILKGTGTPEGATSGTPSTIYLRTDGGPSNAVYVKGSGTGNTGWVPLGTVDPNGTTAQRPGTVMVGSRYFDTTLGKPIWVKSVGPTVWVDATGATV